jgi:hypothetical protein
MKKSVLLLAAALAALFVSCKKEDPQRIQISVKGDGSAERTELAENVKATVEIAVPHKLAGLTLSMELGEFNTIANQYIDISVNKGTTKKNAVFDLIDDSKVVAFLQGLGVAAGKNLLDSESLSVDIKKVILALIKDQMVENDRSFSVTVNVIDKEGAEGAATLRFHYTSAPEIVWPENSSFSPITLNRNSAPVVGNLFKLQVRAQGKIASLVISLGEEKADPSLIRWVVNRVEGDKPVISLTTDPTASNYFRNWFPTDVKGAGSAILNFVFVQENLPEFSDKESLNEFTITVTDNFGKTVQAKAPFLVPAKVQL